MSLSVGWLLEWREKRRVGLPVGQKINTPAFVSVGFGIAALLISGFLWSFYVEPYTGRVSWDAVNVSWLGPLALMCPLPIATILVGGVAEVKARRQDGTGGWMAKLGLTLGVLSMTPALFAFMQVM